jgi:hypothetical protein
MFKIVYRQLMSGLHYGYKISSVDKATKQREVLTNKPSVLVGNWSTCLASPSNKQLMLTICPTKLVRAIPMRVPLSLTEGTTAGEGYPMRMGMMHDARDTEWNQAVSTSAGSRRPITRMVTKAPAAHAAEMIPNRVPWNKESWQRKLWVQEGHPFGRLIGCSPFSADGPRQGYHHCCCRTGKVAGSV